MAEVVSYIIGSLDLSYKHSLAISALYLIVSGSLAAILFKRRDVANWRHKGLVSDISQASPLPLDHITSLGAIKNGFC